MIPWPKILSVVTVPTGGWALKIYISKVAQFDTNFTVTVPAGDYFIAEDNQSSDLLYSLQNLIQAQIDAEVGAGNGVVLIATGHDDTDHTIKFQFLDTFFQGPPGHDIKIAWTESNTDLAAALGFDSSADDSSTGSDEPSITADWQHGYAWFADDDGLLESDGVVDMQSASVLQSRSISGKVRTQFIGESFENNISFQYVPRAKMFSNGSDYGEGSVYPFDRNEGLECWFRQAIQGKRFRYYRSSRISRTYYDDSGVSTASAQTTMTNANRSYDIDPQEFLGGLIMIKDFINTHSVDSLRQCFYISSHTETIFTTPNGHPSGEIICNTDTTYYLYRHTYQTYVLDVSAMPIFAPTELPQIDKYNVKIPVLRYVS